MHKLVELILKRYEEKGISNAEAIALSGIPESTWRRFKNGEGVTLETAEKAGRPVGITFDNASSFLSPEAKEKAEEEGFLKPHSEGCAKACPARKEMNSNLILIRELYEKNEKLYERSIVNKNNLIDRRDADIATLNAKHESDIARLKAEYEAEIATNKADYLADAATAETKYETRISRFRWGTFAMLGIILLLIVFIWYLIFVDFSNPNEGILTTDLLISALEKAGYKIIAP